MRDRPEFYRGAMTGMLFILAADSLHWFITPAAHPVASTARSIGVAVQAVLFLAGAWWFWRRPGPEMEQPHA